MGVCSFTPTLPPMRVCIPSVEIGYLLYYFKILYIECVLQTASISQHVLITLFIEIRERDQVVIFMTWPEQLYVANDVLFLISHLIIHDLVI